MASNYSQERLSHLKTEVDRSLRAFLRRTMALTPNPRALPETGRRRTAPEGMTPSMVRSETQATPGEVTVNVNLMGGTVFLDDERRVRALAKEIKRLIAEDRRRGLGVGG